MEVSYKERCSNCFQEIDNEATECQPCLEEGTNSTLSGFPFKLVDEENNKGFECPICLSLIRDVVELKPCAHIMCKGCLICYEEDQIKELQG